MNEKTDAKDKLDVKKLQTESPAGDTPGAGEKNDNPDAKAPQTEDSPAKATFGAKYVFSVFRENKMTLMAIICVSGMMEIIILFFFMIPLSPIPLLVLLALAFAPGVIVSSQFKNDVIPVCRGVCSEEEIVSGAWKSLAYMWEVCFLCMLPLIVLVLKTIIFHDPWTGHPYDDFGDSIVLSYIVALLGDCALALFPVARLFSRRIGMIVMVVLIFLAQIVLLLHAMLLRIGLPYWTDGDVKVKERNAFAGNLNFFFIMLFAFGVGYFLYAAFHDAEEKGLRY